MELTVIIVLSFCVGTFFPIYWESFKRIFLENEEDFENKPQELNDEIEKKINDLRNENSKLTLELMKFKQNILGEKGYIGDFITFDRFFTQAAVRYNYYVIDFEKLKVKKENGTFEEVFELDQEGEIFPTRESAELKLLAKIEIEEFTKKELKEKYAGHKNEANLEFTSGNVTGIRIPEELHEEMKDVKDKFIKE